MILVDSSVWIDYFNGVRAPATNRLDYLLTHEPLFIGDIILTEVLQGFTKDADFKYAKSLLSKLQFREMLGKDVALQSAINYRLLRKRGITIRKTLDVMIATFCVMHNFSLLHNDRDFRVMEQLLGLTTVN